MIVEFQKLLIASYKVVALGADRFGEDLVIFGMSCDPRDDIRGTRNSQRNEEIQRIVHLGKRHPSLEIGVREGTTKLGQDHRGHDEFKPTCSPEFDDRTRCGQPGTTANECWCENIGIQNRPRHALALTACCR